MITRFRPIDTWPGPATPYRRSSQFRASYSDTIDLLERETDRLGATRVVIQVAVSEDEITINGSRPKANARARHPGVVVAIDSKYGPLKYATDTYTDWQDNLRAIALSLQALRAVDRYGVSRRGEQYTGWRALPAGGSYMTVDGARRLIEGIVGEPVDEITSEIRAKVRKATHPDRGGSTDEFNEAEAALKTLEATR